MTNLVKAEQTAGIVHSVDDMWRMATVLSKAQTFGKMTPEQALTLMLVAQAEGLHPMTAARDYHIIQGRASKTSDAMMASFQQAGGVVEWEELSDTRCAAKFSHPQACPKPVLVDWDMQRAKQAGLLGKDNWKNYPRAMLRARVISEAMKVVYPAALSGMYTPEEVRDFSHPERAETEIVQPPVEVEPSKVPEILPGRTETPVVSEKPGLRAIPLGEPIEVYLSGGERMPNGSIKWSVAIEGGSIIAYCWHKNQPIEATGLDNPEEYDGPAVVVLSKTESGYYTIEEITGVSDA